MSDEPLTADRAREFVFQSALQDSVLGSVGLEVETHLLDLDTVEQRPDWERVMALRGELDEAAGSSAVTFEPGGQLELSGAPAAGIVEAVRVLRHEEQRTRLVLAEHGLGLAHLGADPLREARRTNPGARYAAMQQHFESTGRAGPGLTMMCSTAALQVNLQAGPAASWRNRVALAHRLGPTLIAISATSPWLAGAATGWKSARQRAWGGLDSREVGPIAQSEDPAEEWSRYAMAAPVLFVRAARNPTPGNPTARNPTTGNPTAGKPTTGNPTAGNPTADNPTTGNAAGSAVLPVTQRVSFSEWLSGAAALDGRRPDLGDLQTHLTTLFPPVRLRGYLELRYLDVSGPRWWPAVAALATVLLDDPIAADAAAAATDEVAELWTCAAQHGLADQRLARAARACTRIGVERGPQELAGELSDLAELIDSGRCPGDLLVERIDEIGVHASFLELAHA